MSKGAPSAPDPIVLGAQQSAANTAAAQEQAALNRVNEITPLGNVSFTQNFDEDAFNTALGNFNNLTAFQRAVRAGDRPSANDPEFNPTTRITELNPTAQATFDEQQALGLSLSELANQQTGRIEDTLGQTSDFSNLQNALPTAPGSVDISGLPQLASQQNLDLANLPGFGELPQLNDAARNQIEDALFQRQATRLNQRFGDEQEALNERLANQGIQAGSEAFNTQQERFGRTRNDAFDIATQNAIAGASQEQGRLFNLGLSAAQQQAAERGQVTGERLSQFGADLTNRQQQASERNQLANELFALNASDIQNAQLASALRGQEVTESLTQRNQPINDISALLGNSQVSIPNFGAIPQVGVAPTDVLGANALSLNQGNFNAGLNQQLSNNLFSLGGSLGSAGILASDRRLKRFIRHIGDLMNGLKVYLFKYLWSDDWNIGVMADEVKLIKPEAVVNINGYDHVDYREVLNA